MSMFSSLIRLRWIAALLIEEIEDESLTHQERYLELLGADSTLCDCQKISKRVLGPSHPYTTGLKAASASVRMKLACYKVEVTIGDPSGRSMTATAPGLPPTARDGEPIGETKFVDGLTPHYETAQGFD
jgi:hypothetical protein